MSEIILHGVPVAPGFSIGRVFLFRHDEPLFREFCILEKDQAKEIDRVDAAIDKSKLQLASLRDQLSTVADYLVSQIFDAQSTILDDVMYRDEIIRLIKSEKLNAETAVQRTTEYFQKEMEALDDEVLRQRSKDVQDVGRRIIRNLLGAMHGALNRPKEPSILIADDLLPSDVIHLLGDNVTAVATDLGGSTSHTAILTRSLEAPAVVGLKNLTRTVKTGDTVIVNGNSGKVIINPASKTLRSYRKKLKHYQKYTTRLIDLEKLPAETADGKRIHLRANLELPQEVKSVTARGGEGVGLFRSEYLFLTRNRLPSEEDQYHDYKYVIQSVSPHPVTIRTFDLGGDKVFPNMPHPIEPNPFMGWRAIRVSLDNSDLFHTQLRAILRAAKFGQTKIMVPFISDKSQVKLVRDHIEEVKASLRENNIPHNPNVELGIMIELPSAVIMAESLATEAGFFSIGTNDLTQFTLAVDRGNERVSSLYEPLHPAIIRMIKSTVEAGHKAGIEVALCGEIAANPLATMLLVGLGLDELSVSPVALRECKKLIRSMKYEEAVHFADDAFKFETAEELVHHCREAMKRRFADLPIWFNGEM